MISKVSLGRRSGVYPRGASWIHPTTTNPEMGSKWAQKCLRDYAWGPAVESWLWNRGCGVRAVDSWLWNPCGGMESWLWNPGCGILAE